MFEPADTARVFGIPPGEDFPRLVVQGVCERMSGQPTEAMARLRILVNTRRMQRRLHTLFAEAGIVLLPRIGLVTEIGDLVLETDLPPTVSPLQRRMELAQLVSVLLEKDPDLAPRAALFDLADSLANLLDEMQGEGVDPEAILTLDTSDQSGHWARSRAFIGIVTDYLASAGTAKMDAEARRRAAAEALIRKWEADPPGDPVLIAGSTGSRGTTALLMKAVAKLPQGALIFPGFDMSMPADVWQEILSRGGQEDHPQYRFAALLDRLAVAPDMVAPWTDQATESKRNALISLSLRPAPVTHQWLSDGPLLGDLAEAAADMDLIEAPNQRLEAAAIALAMRNAVCSGDSVALVTPDRTLGRRVSAFLDRWDIVPDDSAGRPLSLTAPGRLLRQVARLVGQPVRSEDLITVLRHPLTRTDGSSRGQHLLETQELELFLRKEGVVLVTEDVLRAFADKDPRRDPWIRWINELLTGLSHRPDPSISAHLAAIVIQAEALAAGPSASGSGELWDRAPGRDTKAAIDTLMEHTVHGPPVSREDVIRLLDRALQGENTRNSDASRPDVMIWGTLEARVQGADVVILGGLNEGTWPARPSPDPWLNRRMRAAAGLLLPERQIGLSAHDYQQAVAARRVILSRSLRDDQAETVPSRWLNRLTNLLAGLPAQGGDKALREMRDRGKRLVSLADAIDHPDEASLREKRPAPAPPVACRPKILSVTEIETLIRDPYAVYARHTLGLRPVNALRPLPDAAMRGSVFHDILDALIADGPYPDAESIAQALKDHAAAIMEVAVPWPSVRSQWLGHLSAIAPEFARAEIERQNIGTVIAREVWGELQLTPAGLGVKGKADRIDRLLGGDLAIYDYKSGSPPSVAVIRHFQRQLPIEAVMAEDGAFKGIAPESVAFVSHIGLNRQTKTDRHELSLTKDHDLRTVTIKGELIELLSRYQDAAKGYPSRRAMEKVRWDGDYDHLARFGEWSDTEPAHLVLLG